MADNSKTTVGALMLLAGGLIGTGLGLLYAPQSGKMSRKTIRRYARKARNEAEDMAREVADSVTDMVDDMSLKTSRLMERGGEVTEDWRNTLMDSMEAGQRNLERQRKKLSQLWR